MSARRTVLVLVLLAGCGVPAPQPATTPAGGGASAAEADATPRERADVVLELRQQDEFVVVLVDGDARGVVDDDETWAAVEKLLARFVNEHPDHAKPSVAIEARPTVDTKAVVRAVDRLFKIGVEDITFNGRPPAASGE